MKHLQKHKTIKSKTQKADEDYLKALSKAFVKADQDVIRVSLYIAVALGDINDL